MRSLDSDLGSSIIDDAVRSYRGNGYFIARNILPQEDVLATLEDMHRVFRQQLDFLGIRSSSDSGERALHEDMAKLLGASVDRYLASLRLCARLFRLHALFMHERVRTLAASLGASFPVFQTSPVFHVMSADLRIPGGYYGYGVHQDWPALQSGLDTVNVWLPFVDVDGKNYTLDIIPGSHLGGLYAGEMGSNAFEIDPGQYKEGDFSPVCAGPGDALLMSVFLVHRSSTKGGNRVRIASSMRYENAADPYFIEHAYPTVHKRVVERRFLYDDLPATERIRAVFGS